MPPDLNDTLVKAARNGHIKVVKQLLDEGADPRFGNSRSLWAAATSGHLEVVKLLLPVTDPRANNSWSLRRAAENGHLEIVRLLLPVSDPKAADSLALRFAAKNGHLEIIKLLLPLSDVDKVMLDPGNIRADVCDLLLSCLPLPRVKEFVATHPSLDLPHSHAMLGAENLRNRSQPVLNHHTNRQRA